MTEYKADKELAGILVNNGFIDSTSQRDKIKGKQSFKLSKQARKKIHFDYVNISIIKGSHITESKLFLTAEELKIVILYFKLSSSDSRVFESINGFKINYALDKINTIEKELSLLLSSASKTRHLMKLKRITSLYHSIIV